MYLYNGLITEQYIFKVPQPFLIVVLERKFRLFHFHAVYRSTMLVAYCKHTKFLLNVRNSIVSNKCY